MDVHVERASPEVGVGSRRCSTGRAGPRIVEQDVETAEGGDGSSTIRVQSASLERSPRTLTAEPPAATISATVAAASASLVR